MFSNYRFLCSEISKNKSVIRAFLNLRLSNEYLKGKTIDVGGGGGDSYISFVKRDKDVTFETFDLKVGKQVDFEKDPLPARDATYDTVVFLNVMEHIFNYQHIANEVVRILKPGGKLIGFVPFLMWYHPDHKDFFRYTHEALQIIFDKTGASKVTIEPIARGPFAAASHMTLLSYPRFMRVLIFSLSYFMDSLYLALRKNNSSKYMLGYMFIVDK